MRSRVGYRWLKTNELLKELEKYGIIVARSTLSRWIKEGYIPPDYYETRQHGRSVWYYFYPETVDYIINNIIKQGSRAKAVSE